MARTSEAITDLKSKFNPAAAKGMSEVFQFLIKDAGDYYIDVQDGKCIISDGEHDDPSVTLKMDKATLKSLLNGELKGMTAFMTGRIKAEGDIMLATKLSSLFSI